MTGSVIGQFLIFWSVMTGFHLSSLQFCHPYNPGILSQKDLLGIPSGRDLLCGNTIYVSLSLPMFSFFLTGESRDRGSM